MLDLDFQPSSTLNVELVQTLLDLKQSPRTIVHLPTVGSTNQVALEAAQQGATSGVWVADEQTAGRGRGGHGWHSAAGDGLYVSVLVTPKLPLRLGLWLSLATGLAAQTAIHRTSSIQPDIRWPNDLLIAGKKCGGILVESSAAAGSEYLRYAVIGVGINVQQERFPAELAESATSLRIATGRVSSRETVLSHLLVELDREIAELERQAAGQFSGPGLLERFSAASTWVRGMRVSVPEQGGYTGITRGLDERGFLLVEDDQGTLRTVLSGGVRPE